MKINEGVYDYLGNYKRRIVKTKEIFESDFEIVSVHTATEIEEDIDEYTSKNKLLAGGTSDIKRRVCKYLISDKDEEKEENPRTRTLEGYYLHEIDPYVRNQVGAVEINSNDKELYPDGLLVGLRTLDTKSPVEQDKLDRIIVDIADDVVAFVSGINDTNPDYVSGKQALRDFITDLVDQKIRVVKNVADYSFGSSVDSINEDTSKLKEAVRDMMIEEEKRKHLG